MGFWSRIFGGKEKAGEGLFRPGPYAVTGGYLPDGAPLNWWQMGMSPMPAASASAMVEACVGAYSQTVAMCPGDHWKLRPDGGRDRLNTSALSRVLRRPNDYQSISDFMMNLTRSLYQEGNAYALALRNERQEIAELHLMRSASCYHRVAEDGSIFYALGGNEIIDRRLGGLAGVPARDVLHVRLHTPQTPLRGETPLMAAAMDVAAGDAALRQQIAFFQNQARPSIMLSTDHRLTLPQVMELREGWNKQTRGENAGGTPILTDGLKPLTVSTTAQDAQLAETMKMSDQNIALAFRVPLQILGVGGPTYASTELLMQSWIASGLGFALNHIEEAFGQLFRLRGVPDEYVEFSTKSLLRSAYRDRIEALARGVQGGIYSPDEARAEEELPEVPGGHGAEPRLQQQVMPLSWHTQPPAEAPPVAPPASPEPAQDQEVPDDRGGADAIVSRIERLARLH